MVQKRLKFLSSGWRSVAMPMLLAMALLTVAAMASLTLLNAGRAFAGAQAMWTHARHEATEALRRYATAQDPAALARFRSQIATLSGYSQALQAMQGPEPDMAAAQAGLVAGGNLPEDAADMVRVFHLLSAHWRFKDVKDSWVRTDAVGMALVRMGQAPPPLGPEATQAWLARIAEVERSMDLLERRSQHELAKVGRATYQAMAALLLALAVLVAGLGAWAIRRVMHQRALQHRDFLQAQGETALALRCAGMGMFKLVPATATYHIDDTVARMHGLPHAMPVSRDGMRALILPQDREIARQAVEHAIRTGGLHGFQYRVRLPDGRVRWIESHGQIEPDSAVVLGVSRDVTDEIAAREGAAQLETEREISRAQRAFLSRLSHELRTPINAILGFTELVAMDEAQQLSAKDQRRLGFITGAGRQLLTLVEDILDLHKLEAGQIKVKPVAVDVAAVLSDCLPMVETLAAQHRVAIRTERQPGDTLWAMADPQRLQQVFLNLLTNGCKYNRAEGVLRVVAEARGAHIAIAFHDQGAGLSAKDIEGLFQPFQRIERTAERVEGSGLGLAIVRQIVAAMGGSIEVSSSVGEGSCFEVRLPVAQAPSAPAPESAQAALTGCAG